MCAFSPSTFKRFLHMNNLNHNFDCHAKKNKKLPTKLLFYIFSSFIYFCFFFGRVDVSRAWRRQTQWQKTIYQTIHTIHTFRSIEKCANIMYFDFWYNGIEYHSIWIFLFETNMRSVDARNNGVRSNCDFEYVINILFCIVQNETPALLVHLNGFSIQHIHNIYIYMMRCDKENKKHKRQHTHTQRADVSLHIQAESIKAKKEKYLDQTVKHQPAKKQWKCNKICAEQKG